jgi:hypothetical protein
MVEQKIFLHGKTEATISCEKCGRIRTLSLSQATRINTPVGVKCPCGHHFTVIFEKRAHYRKETSLRGRYGRIGGEDSGEMIVTNLSHSGLCFNPLKVLDIEQGDHIWLRLNLDDAVGSIIEVDAIVMSMQQETVGVKFCDLDEMAKKALGFYLLP